MSAQEEFDRTYITSIEICKKLNVTRATVARGRRRGLLPDPVQINGVQLTLWKRDTVEPFLQAWQLNLQARRGELVQ